MGQQFDNKKYLDALRSLRQTHGRELARHGWKSKDVIFRGRDAETATSINKMPCILMVLVAECKILEITPDHIVFDMLCGDRKYFAKAGEKSDYWEYN